MLPEEFLETLGLIEFGEPAPDATTPTREIPPYNSVSLKPLLILQSVLVRDIVEKREYINKMSFNK